MPPIYLEPLEAALREVLVVVFADDLALLEPVVLHALHAGQLELAAPVVGVGEPVREHVREPVPEPGWAPPAREEHNI